jgi:hypothetical protein
MLNVCIVLMAIATGASAACQQQKSVYSFVTDDSKAHWELHKWFQMALVHANIDQEQLSVHVSHVGKDSYGVQVKMCPDAVEQDRKFRCELRHMQDNQQFIYTFRTGTYVYRPMPGFAQVLPLRTGAETVDGSRWPNLLGPMTYAGGVHSGTCGLH